ncbi:MAG TPA: hypothetical protein VMH90_02570, partial [Thermoplasmata archaeon]|nr:hypothetical protein [Thermoplasmata archaeon]
MIPIRPRSARRPGLAPLAGVLLLLVLAGLPMAGGARATSAPAPAPAPSSARLLHLQDSKNLTRLVGTTLSTLTDTLTVPKVPLAIRSYTIRMSASLAIPTVAVLLQTLPAASWGGPDQFPYGPDNLPPIAEWTWWVRTGAGMNDTANWTVDPDGTHLDRLTTWSTRTFVVSGTSAPVLTVGIDPSNR